MFGKQILRAEIKELTESRDLWRSKAQATFQEIARKDKQLDELRTTISRLESEKQKVKESRIEETKKAIENEEGLKKGHQKEISRLFDEAKRIQDASNECKKTWREQEEAISQDCKQKSIEIQRLQHQVEVLEEDRIYLSGNVSHFQEKYNKIKVSTFKDFDALFEWWEEYRAQGESQLKESIELFRESFREE